MQRDKGTPSDQAMPVTNIRLELEQRERQILAPQAAKSADTRGRLRPSRKIRSAPRFSAIAIA